jgi:hypothetical protein
MILFWIDQTYQLKFRSNKQSAVSCPVVFLGDVHTHDQGVDPPDLEQFAASLVFMLFLFIILTSSTLKVVSPTHLYQE